MVKFIVGLKGSGKTKTLIDMVNSTVATCDGSVICIEKGPSLVHEIKYQARLIDTEEYNIDTWRSLFGFVAGIVASNHDAKDIFIDSSLKIVNSKEDLITFLNALIPFAEQHELRVVATVSMAKEDLPENLQQYC